jgi:hypothetical protein
MVPWPFKGIGAYRRLMLYGWKDYSGIGGKWYTGQDLSRWHQHAYQLLLAAQ